MATIRNINNSNQKLLPKVSKNSIEDYGLPLNTLYRFA